MGFALKKFVSFWLMPLPLCLVLLTVGIALLAFSRRRALGRALALTGLVLLLLFSNKAVSTWLIQPLESAYPAIPEFTATQPPPSALAACRHVVVLGGGHGNVPAFSAVNKLSSSARGRLIEAVRIIRALPDARLVLTGHGGPDLPSHASVMAEAALSLGVDPARLVRLDSPRDTDDEIAQVQALVGTEPFALVTSAWHLRRAVSFAKKRGLDPVPVPSDYAARRGETLTLNDYTWDVESLGRSTWAVYERIGYAWARLRGQAL